MRLAGERELPGRGQPFAVQQYVMSRCVLPKPRLRSDTHDLAAPNVRMNTYRPWVRSMVQVHKA